MLEIFRQHGIEFEQIFICPHMPQDHCACRKPKTGLVDAFWKENKEEIDLENSFMCGDRDTDRQFAQNLGIRFLPMETNGIFPHIRDILQR